jgi:hypothetical protein
MISAFRHCSISENIACSCICQSLTLCVLSNSTPRRHLLTVLGIVIDITRRDIDGAAQSKESGSGRVLIISADKDDTAQFTKLMSSFFAAQKKYITVDCCHISADDSDSSYLQQGVEIANGLYLRPQHQNALAQYLLVHAAT